MGVNDMEKEIAALKAESDRWKAEVEKMIYEEKAMSFDNHGHDTTRGATLRDGAVAALEELIRRMESE